jgi:hypothetical protein
MDTSGLDGAPEAATAHWAERCLARMVVLDPQADRALLAPIVRDMSCSERWRGMSPEAAADWCFGP